MLKLIQQSCPESKIFSMGMHIHTLQNSMENKKNEVNPTHFEIELSSLDSINRNL